ncbi:MAG: AAA family ATPase [Bacteroidetes bacterium]|nr:AAA family ATPase [Bacteroidota bacterium]
MKHQKLYIAATSQHVGKTTSTLGLVYALRKQGYDVGYCKPVGQEFVDLGTLKADKDALLFANFMGFQLNASIHSPVILGQGATSDFLDQPSGFDFAGDITHAAKFLEGNHEMVVYEGTGHPGVGAVVGLSNADVAHLLGASVIMVVKGGIGNTIDRLQLSLSLFRERGVPVVGVIVNKVRTDKLDKVKHYLSKYLKSINIPLLGLIPFDQKMTNPMMHTIKDAVNGSVVMNGEYLDNQVEEIIAGSLVDRQELRHFQNLLLVVSSNRLEEALRKIKFFSYRAGVEQTPLSGIILTSDLDIPEWCSEYIRINKIPLVNTSLDTFGSVVKISRIEVKINLRTPWKVERACELIEENVKLDLIC